MAKNGDSHLLELEGDDREASHEGVKPLLAESLTSNNEIGSRHGISYLKLSV